MKGLWWVSMVVFLVGIAVGCGLSRMAEAQEGTLPQFIASPTQTRPQETAPAVKPLQGTSGGLPQSLPYTTLVVQELVCYDGPYWEDGSMEDVFGVAALLLRNTGTIGIEYAQIVMVQEGQTLSFDATYIPPRSAVLILEENRTPYSDSPISECRCRTVIPGSFDMAQREIGLADQGLSGLSVTNLTQETIPCVRIFYKHHYGPADLYQGGITYSTMIQDLQPGETRVIRPYRYTAGYSQTVAVIVE